VNLSRDLLLSCAEWAIVLLVVVIVFTLAVSIFGLLKGKGGDAND
jgi:hypothetical protein